MQLVLHWLIVTDNREQNYLVECIVNKCTFVACSGAQGEYAGLRTIMAYLAANGESHRTVR